MSDDLKPRRTFCGLGRGAKGRCPNCGEGRLFRGYLKVEPTCAACGHDNGRYRADDGPAYFTILLVGHLIIGPILAFNVIHQADPWTVVAWSLPLLFLVTLAVLRIAKGGLIGVLWGTRAGSAQ